MIEEALAIEDTDARNGATRRSPKLHEEAASAFLLHETAVWGTQADVEGFEPHPLDLLRPHRGPQRRLTVPAVARHRTKEITMKFTPYWLDTAPAGTGSVAHRDRRARRRRDRRGRSDRPLGRPAPGAQGRQRRRLRTGDRRLGRVGTQRGHGHHRVSRSDSVTRSPGTDSRPRVRSSWPTTTRSTRIEKLVGEEGIDCDFARTGKMNLAAKPGHLDGLARPTRCWPSAWATRRTWCPRASCARRSARTSTTAR